MFSKHKDKTVMVVDDEMFILKTTEAVLKRLGYNNILLANSAEEALQCLNSANPPIGLIINDLNMPDIDGVELLRKYDESGYEGDVVLFSGEDQQTLKMAENLARARNLSVLGAISKPLEPIKFSEVLNKEGTSKKTKYKSSAKIIDYEVMSKAIDAGEIEPWFQPKVDIVSKEVVGVEALARWNSTELGQVFPDTFIPAAEELGLIDKMTFSLIRKVSQYAKNWREAGIHLKVAVNISMDSLSNLDFPEQLDQLLKDDSGALKDLQLEVTESKLMEDLLQPLEVLLRLRLKRIELSIDDFGTGHSNLTQLRDLPFDELKLDRSFIHGNSDAERSKAILESSVEIGKKLNMSIVAEGVETLEEWIQVEKLGCDQVQGYFIAKPMPAEDLIQWIKKWPHLRETLFTVNNK